MSKGILLNQLKTFLPLKMNGKISLIAIILILPFSFCISVLLMFNIAMTLYFAKIADMSFNVFFSLVFFCCIVIFLVLTNIHNKLMADEHVRYLLGQKKEKGNGL